MSLYVCGPVTLINWIQNYLSYYTGANLEYNILNINSYSIKCLVYYNIASLHAIWIIMIAGIFLQGRACLLMCSHCWRTCLHWESHSRFWRYNLWWQSLTFLKWTFKGNIVIQTYPPDKPVQTSYVSLPLGSIVTVTLLDDVQYTDSPQFANLTWSWKNKN